MTQQTLKTPTTESITIDPVYKHHLIMLNEEEYDTYKEDKLVRPFEVVQQTMENEDTMIIHNSRVFNTTHPDQSETQNEDTHI